jgi:hypothetical protein
MSCGVAGAMFARRYAIAAIPVLFSMASAAALAGACESGSAPSVAALSLLARAVDRAAVSHAAQVSAFASWISEPLNSAGGGGTTLAVCCAGVIGLPSATAVPTVAAAAMANAPAATTIPVRRGRGVS